jgi:hypothetical protein
VTAAARLTPQQAERLCTDAIDAVTMYSTGEADAAELAELDPTLLEGLVLYCQLLETTLIAQAGQFTAQVAAMTGKPNGGAPLQIKDVRGAARASAGAWRRPGDEATS